MKTGWHDITTAEWLAMQGKQEQEIYQALTGRPAEEELTATESALVAEILSGFGPLPEAELEFNVESQTVGQFETAKSFLKRFYKEDPQLYRVNAIPYLFGLYRAIRVNGKWDNARCMQLAKACRAMPSEQVVPVGLAILKQIEEVSQRYDALAYDPDDAGNDDAGEEELETFGFYNALHLLAGGDLLKHAEIMQQSVRTVYTHLLYLKKLAKSQKQEAA